jgi:hypothetical protein
MDSYERKRKDHTDISGTLTRTAAQGDATLVTVRSLKHTIYIQRIIVWISTDAAQSWSFEDDGVPLQIAEIPASPGDSTRWDFDFGAEGMPLAEGKDFELNVSAAGLAGNIRWEGFMKLSSTIAHSSGAASQ